jgi:hypothetical protein
MPDEPRRPAPMSAPAAPAEIPEHHEPGEAAPFLSWTALYLVVAAALASEIAAFATITWIYR